MKESLYPSFSVMLVDDEVDWLHSMAIVLERSLCVNNVIKCRDSREVMDMLAKHDVGLVLLDLIMPHMRGENLLLRITQDHPEAAVIVITAMDEVGSAVDCMKKGAYDYFVKTVEEERLVAGVQRAIRMLELEREHSKLKSGMLGGRLAHPDAFAKIITNDQAMRSLFLYVEAVAHSSQPVLITGESGTGKELISMALHEVSGREGVWVPVNVAGLDDNVFADTLFGHLKGAFTGADQHRRGLVEKAAGGTLFLDEIGDLSHASQVKLLRLLENGEYCALGSDICHRTDARIVVATNQDLAGKEASGVFRKDLYYRLNAHHIHVPPLREHPDDIPLLLKHFLEEAALELKKHEPTPPRELALLLSTHHFPGNIRELRSMVFDAVSVHRHGKLSMDSFKKSMGQAKNTVTPAIAGQTESDAEPNLTIGPRFPTFKEALDLLVGEAMKRAQGNQTQAARLLGISRPALSKRLKKKNG